MKKFIFVLMAMASFVSIYAKDIQELVVTTNPPMHCENCENKIKKGDLRFLKGVQKIETNIPDQRVTVVYDADKANPQQIEEAFKKTGYSVEVINNNEETTQTETISVQACKGGCCGKKIENL